MKTSTKSILNSVDEINESLSDLVPKAIDLDLPSKTLWADRNVGANKPEGCGDYIDWDTVKNTKINNLHCPTLEQMKELQNECKWEYAKINEINGFKIIGKNGRSIFLPAAGCKDNNEADAKYIGWIGLYWAHDIYGKIGLVQCLYFDSTNIYSSDDDYNSECLTMRLVQ